MGPILGIAIGAAAITANVFSMSRFWRLQHRWRRPVIVRLSGVIGFLLVLIGLDVAELVARA